MDIPEEIVAFLASHHVLSLSVCDDGWPWAASVFFVFEPQTARFLFVGSPETRHNGAILTRRYVAGTVAGQPRDIARIQGLQFQGRCWMIGEGSTRSCAYELFYHRFPDAKVRPAPIWAIDVQHMKYTTNHRRFGEKIMWDRD